MSKSERTPSGPPGCIWIAKQRVRYVAEGSHLWGGITSGMEGTFWIGVDPYAGPGTYDLKTHILEFMPDSGSVQGEWYESAEEVLEAWDDESSRVVYLGPAADE